MLEFKDAKQDKDGNPVWDKKPMTVSRVDDVLGDFIHQLLQDVKIPMLKTILFHESFEIPYGKQLTQAKSALVKLLKEQVGKVQGYELDLIRREDVIERIEEIMKCSGSL